MVTKKSRAARCDATKSFKRFGVSRKAVVVCIAVTLAGLGAAGLAKPTDPFLETSPAYEEAALGLRSGAKKNYEFNNIPLLDVLGFLADDAGIAMVALPGEQQKESNLVTVSLNLSPFSALEFVARNNDVALVLEEDTWHMRPFDDEQLISKIYNINGDFSSLPTEDTENTIDNLIESIRELIGITLEASDLNPTNTLSSADNKTATSEVFWDSGNKELRVVATRREHQWVEGYVDRFEEPQAPIAVEVKFVFEAAKERIGRLGLDWSGVMAGGYDFSPSGLELREVNLDQARDSAAPKTAILNTNDMILCISSLLGGRDNPTVIAYPRVLTPNNREVSIQSVVNQPVVSPNMTSVTGGPSSVTYLPIGTSINVLPKRLTDGRIRLQALITISDVTGSEVIDGNSYPLATTRQFTTSLDIESGSTLVIGGLDNPNESVGEPGGSVPSGRNFYRNMEQRQSSKNLMIFITPTLVDARAENPAEKSISAVPLGGDTERVIETPRLRPDGKLVGGIDALGNAILWMEQEYRPIEQRVIEHSSKKSDREFIQRLINTVEVLGGLISDMSDDSPDDAGTLEVHQSNLDKLESRMLKSRDAVSKSKLSSSNKNSIPVTESIIESGQNTER